jgi:hypothetical protein
MGLTNPILPVPDLLATPDVLQLGLPNSNLYPYDIGPEGGTVFLFNRAWEVTLTAALAGPPGPVTYNTLRTVFEVEKTAFSTANKSKISVYNFNDLTSKLYVKGGFISLAVGYGGVGSPVLPLITNNSIYRVHHERKGPDLISTYEGGEGEANLQSSIFNASYPAGTPITTIISALIAAMGLVVGPQIGLPPLVYNSGTVWSGSCKDLMDRAVIKELGLSWWVNGYSVTIAPAGSAAIPNAVIVSEQTGLIGTPNFGQGTGGDNVISFTSLINPFLIPGTPVSIISDFLTALGVIKIAKFEGDTHTSKWTVACEATPLNPASLSGINTQI